MEKRFVFVITILLFTNPSFSQSWTIYNTLNSGMLQNEVRAIAFQQDTTAWVALKNGGIVKFKNNIWIQVDTSIIPISAYDISDISTAPNNDVWITATNSPTSMAKQYVNNISWTVHPFLFNSGLNCVEIDSSGIVWIGNFANGGLYRYDGTTFKNFNEFNSNNPNDYVHGIGIISSTKRWVCGTHEIGLMNNDTVWTVFPYLTSPYPLQWDVAVENDTLVWFASTYGLIKYDNNAWTIYNNSNSGMPLDSNSTFENFPKLAVDKNGVKWMATGVFGLVKYDGTNWTTYNTSNSPLPSNKIKTVEIGKDNSVWVGTDSGLAILSNPVIPLGLANNNAISNNITIYPNPAKNKIIIRGIENFSLSNYSIFNINGIKIKQGILVDEIDISGLKKGFYFFEINNQDIRIIKKIQKD